MSFYELRNQNPKSVRPSTHARMRFLNKFPKKWLGGVYFQIKNIWIFAPKINNFGHFWLIENSNEIFLVIFATNSIAHAPDPTGGTCGLSLPVGLVLLHVVRVRRRSRSHFYSLQTARQGERKIFESLSESERKRATLALITDLLFCFYTRFDNEKSDLDSKVKLCYPRPFEMALTFTIATFRWEHSLASFFMLFFRAKRIERSENFFSSPFDDFTVNF